MFSGEVLKNNDCDKESNRNFQSCCLWKRNSKDNFEKFKSHKILNSMIN